jgi:hypothetical protein
MSGDFRLDSDNATHDLLENSLASVLLGRGFEVVFHLGGRPGRRITEYKKNNENVSVRSEIYNWPGGERRVGRSLIAHSDQVDLDELTSQAIELLVNNLLTELTKPFLKHESFPADLLRRRIHRLIRDIRFSEFA